MRLVSEAIILTNDNRRIELRPSLRAAYILHEKHRLENLWKGVLDGNFTIISDIVAHGADDPVAARALLNDKLASEGIGALVAISDDLLTFINLSFGLNYQTATAPSRSTVSKSGKNQTYQESFNELFGYATGWLGWTPETAWNSTPAEIRIAFDAHVEKLRAIHGSTEKQSSTYDPLEEVSPEDVSAGIAKLRAKHGSVARAS
ncbi:phage tail assembly chaperone [Phyllobacterium bourgognense]|uniref:Tail assembly chaperone n=1 Tax=Phyllobacterium bourgognense TaxID=314236 RepID=A0A368YZ07_9HYPH|nr:phage tail assembly chaperone [Phyllobacterium bourgognense]RCW85433.1 tail assembly chaperone [Phyllobacterium bourgognense]